MAQHENDFRSKGSARRWSRWWVAAGAVAALPLLAFAALHVLLRLDWTERQVRRQLSRVAVAASGGEYTADFRSLRFGFSLNDLRIEEVTVAPANPPDSGVATPRAVLEELEVQGIHWWRTLLGHPAVDGVLVRAPELDLSLDQLRSGEGSSVVDDTVESDAATDAPVEIETARLVGEVMTVRSQTENGLVAAVLRGVDLEIGGLGEAWLAAPVDILARADVSLGVRSTHVAIGDSLYSLDLGGVKASSSDSVLRIESLQMGPQMSDSAFAARLPYRRDRIVLALTGVELHAADLSAALRDGAIRAGRIVVDSLHIDVYSDHRIAPRPTTDARSFLTEEIRDLGSPIAIDTTVVMGGSIRYAERAADAAQPGVIEFLEVTGAIINLSNHPELGMPDLMVARMTASLFGEARIAARLEVPLSAPADIRFAARAGAANATILNRVTVPLEGIEFLKGELDTLYLEGSATNGVATGTVHMEYRDLGLQTVDKNTGEQNLGHVLATLLADALVVREENVAQRAGLPVLGRIYHVRADDDTMWRFLWRGIRSGLLSVVVRGR